MERRFVKKRATAATEQEARDTEVLWLYGKHYELGGQS
jgi:hypothetical protein